MKLTLTRLIGAIGLAVMAGGRVSGGAALAQDREQGDNRPPQTLPRGFESIEASRSCSETRKQPKTSHFTPHGWWRAADS
jgi:hypothetical protein